MFKPLVSRLTRVALVPAVVAGALAVAQPAFATDYCVAPNGSCAGANNLQDFQDALNAAAADSSPDRILLGAGTYTAKTAGGFSYNPANGGPVEIAGTGAGGATATVLAGPLGGSRVLNVFGGAGTSIHDVQVLIPPFAIEPISGISTNGVARHVMVTEDDSVETKDRAGVILTGSGALEDSDVLLSEVGITTGVITDSGATSVRGSRVDARVGIESNHGGTVDRTRLHASLAGVHMNAGDMKLTSSLIHTTEDGSVGLTANVSGDATVEIDGATIVGPGNGAKFGTGVDGYNTYSPAASVDLVLRNSIIRDYPTSLYAGGDAPGHAHISASYSDYDPAKDFTTGPNAAIAETNVSNIGNVGFGPVDHQPAEGSPLIDAGDPATPQGLDLAGNPLVTDGNHDGVARRDIGAFELPGPLPGAGDAPAPAGDVTPASGGDQPTPPASAAADTTAPLVSGLRLSHTSFAVGRARTAVSARVARGTRFSYSLSEAAKVVVKIQRVGTKRTAGRLIRSAKGGKNVLRFSGRIGAKALKPGRYRAVMVATDAAGNRSPAKSVRFRVLNG
jgi:hypothetical protein